MLMLALGEPRDHLAQSAGRLAGIQRLLRLRVVLARHHVEEAGAALEGIRFVTGQRRVERIDMGVGDRENALSENRQLEAKVLRDLPLGWRPPKLRPQRRLAPSIARASRLTFRGTQSRERRASIIAPRILCIAKLPNLTPRSGSKRSIALSRPLSPKETSSASSTCSGSRERRRPAATLTSGA
jgi:hypothetical protein